MRTWWQLLRQRGLLGSEPVRARRTIGNSHIISDRALRLAAEVLEPRCLLTDATGLAAHDGGGDILVDASLWDDAGLTLLRTGGLVHLVRTGTTQDVIAPFSAYDYYGRLIIQGRDDASDVLTIDISGIVFGASDWQYFDPLISKGLSIDGGIGTGFDEVRLIGAPRGEWGMDESRIAVGALEDHRSSLSMWDADYHGFGFYYSNVELVVNPLGTYAKIEFGSDDDDITIEYGGNDELVRIIDETVGIELQLPWFARLDAGTGDDLITVVRPEPFGSHLARTLFDPYLFNVDGGDGKDVLNGSEGDDKLFGGAGDDSIFAHGGDDTIGGELGNDLLDGGFGSDYLVEHSWNDGETIVLGSNTIEGIGDDRFMDIERLGMDVFGDGTLIDASAFPGSVYLVGFGELVTLMGGAGADEIWNDYENNLLIGGDGDDLLGSSSPSTVLDGGAGDDTVLCGWDEVLNYFGLDAGEGDPIPNATATPIVPPPDDMLLGQGLDEPRDEDATLPETLVTDAEAAGEDSGLNELDGQESNQDDENDSADADSITWDAMLTNPLLPDELLDGDLGEPTPAEPV